MRSANVALHFIGACNSRLGRQHALTARTTTKSRQHGSETAKVCLRLHSTLNEHVWPDRPTLTEVVTP